MPFEFDAEDLLRGLLPWVEVESPTHHPAGVNRMLDLVSAGLASVGGRSERLRGTQGFGDIASIRFPGISDARGILVLAHVDTVHEVGTLEGPLRIRRDGNRVYGPGICDMKGGLYTAFAAMREIWRAGLTTPLPVTFMLIPDEEVGSPSSRGAIEEAAADASCVLVPEPSRTGGFVTGRHAIARFILTVHGRPAHAGADPRAGRSAIREMARLVPLIEELADPVAGSTVSVGIVRGGSFVNVVPTVCRAEILVMAPTDAALDAVRQGLKTIEPVDDGLRVELRDGPLRPVFEATAGTMALYETARRIALDLGFDPPHGSAGGGSDGNFTGALGVPTLDGLGVEGDGIHTKEEHILIASLPVRARLMAHLLLDLH